MQNEKFISHTRQWIIDVVIGCNFCPFANKEVKRDSISYTVVQNANEAKIAASLTAIFKALDVQPELETALLIFPYSFTDFEDYLELVEKAENHLEQTGLEGIYQIASFHPQYVFAGSDENDAANYTNRSPYPMLHILRESSLEKVIDLHPDTLQIPENNIAFANKKGLAEMQRLRELCFRNPFV